MKLNEAKQISRRQATILHELKQLICLRSDSIGTKKVNLFTQLSGKAMPSS